MFRPVHSARHIFVNSFTQLLLVVDFQIQVYFCSNNLPCKVREKCSEIVLELGMKDLKLFKRSMEENRHEKRTDVAISSSTTSSSSVCSRLDFKSKSIICSRNLTPRFQGALTFDDRVKF